MLALRLANDTGRDLDPGDLAATVAAVGMVWARHHPDREHAVDVALVTALPGWPPAGAPPDVADLNPGGYCSPDGRSLTLVWPTTTAEGDGEMHQAGLIRLAAHETMHLAQWGRDGALPTRAEAERWLLGDPDERIDALELEADAESLDVLAGLYPWCRGEIPLGHPGRERTVAFPAESAYRAAWARVQRGQLPCRLLPPSAPARRR